MRYWVSVRIPAICLRMALGASAPDVFRLVIGKAAAPFSLGIPLGIAGAFGVQEFIASELYGVSTAMGLVSLMAAFLPARSAARIDPMVALRE